MKKKAHVIFQPYFEYKLYYCPGHEWKRNIDEAIIYETKQLAKKHLFRLQTFATQQLKKAGISSDALVIEPIDKF